MRRVTLGLVAATGLVLAGCGTVPEGAIEAEAAACPPDSDCYDEVQPVGPGGELEIEMGNFYFEVLDGTPITGDLEVTAVNASDAYHNVEFLGAAEGSEIPEAEGGEVGTGVVKLFPGEWTFICNVPGHRSAGMEATVTIYATEEEAAAAQDEATGEAPEEGADPTGPEQEPVLPDAGGDRDEGDSEEPPSGEPTDATEGSQV